MAIDKRNPVDRKEFTEMLDTIGKNGQADAAPNQYGVVKQMTFTAQLTAAPTQADFNSLLTKLIAAGLMASS